MKRLVILLLALATLTSGMSGCGSARVSKAMPTPQPSPPPPPLPTQLPEIRTICLQVNQGSPEIEGDFFLPIADTVEELLKGSGVRVPADGASCEATLACTPTGTPLGKDHVNVGLTGKGTSYCCTGATIEGEIVITVSDRAILTLPFDLTQGPRSGTITSCPGKAAFGVLWHRALKARREFRRAKAPAEGQSLHPWAAPSFILSLCYPDPCACVEECNKHRREGRLDAGT